MQVVNWILFFVVNILFLIFLIACIVEREGRAAIFATIGILANSSIWNIFILFNHVKIVSLANVVFIILLGMFGLISMVKFFPKKESRDLSSIEKYDERDNMFSRNILQFYPQLAHKYYSDYPEKQAVDKKIHTKPELGELDHLFYDTYKSPIFKAAFDYLLRTRDLAWGPLAQEKKSVDKEEITAAIKEIACLYGAVDVGVTLLKSYHLYSHRGRVEKDWGEEIQNFHKYAIVIVVRMDVKMINFAPELPIIQESAHQYVEAAKIADIIAQYIRSFGYDSRSHKDSNYETLCVPLAIDSGLGVLGRLGLFMHHIHGPCVRLSIVTTELELMPSQNRSVDQSPEEFCNICKKCADNCPIQAICNGEEPSSRGFRHWTIDQEKCYSFWKSIGTDCGMCIRVCPYTKPDTLIHKIVRFYVSRNSFNQRVALFLDDLVYGRKFKFQ